MSSRIRQRGVYCVWGQHLNGFYRREHCHEGIEVVYCEKGDGEYTVGTRNLRLAPGSLLFFRAEIPHCANVQSIYERWNLCFIPMRLFSEQEQERTSSPFLHGNANSALHTIKDEERQRVRRIFEEIFIELHKENGETLRLTRLLIEQLLLMAQKSRMVEREDPIQAVSKPKTLASLFAYIEAHLRENLTPEQLARKFGYSKGHIWRMIRDATNQSPTEYITTRRLVRARKVLITTRLPIAMVADQVGFNSASYFCRCFRREFGITPGEYRLKHQWKSGALSTLK